MASSSVRSTLSAPPVLHVTDVGATPIVGGKNPWAPLLDAGAVEVLGFEPDPDGYAALISAAGPRERYLPWALGDGERHTLHVCKSPGMTSFLRPNVDVLRHFPMFEEWGRVLRTVDVDTRRLDDVGPERTDLLKLDVQGYELEILRHARRLLANTLVVQVEVEFLPMYVEQPLFADVDAFLRSQGFGFHRFHKLKSRVWQPWPTKTPYEGLSQHLWADAVYVRSLLSLEALSADELIRLALILEDVFGSHDLAARALGVARQR